MDRDLLVGNRRIANFMQQKQKQRLQQRLKNIKKHKSVYSSKGIIKQKPSTNSVVLQKNMQVQKQNILLFTRIASIIRSKPKSLLPLKDRSLQNLSLSKINTSFLNDICEQNKLLEKRLVEQKPTINNKLFYKERQRNQKYLKNMGKFPYMLNRRVRTDMDQHTQDSNKEQKCWENLTQILPFLSKINPQQRQKENQSLENNCQIKQLYKHQSLDFITIIQYDSLTELFSFSIQHLHQKQQNYQLNMIKQEFIELFEQCGYQYQKMVSNLRVNDQGKIIYQTNSDQIKKDHKQSLSILETNRYQKTNSNKFKPESTSYTSTVSKSGLFIKKRRMLSKNQNEMVPMINSQRKIVRLSIPKQKNKTMSKIQKQSDANNYWRVKQFPKLQDEAN